MAEANKHIFVKHFLGLMRLIYAVFIGGFWGFGIPISPATILSEMKQSRVGRY
jgi:hypothetical protein